MIRLLLTTMKFALIVFTIISPFIIGALMELNTCDYTCLMQGAR